MTHDSMTLYKLIILYMLDSVDFALTAAQISDFMLETGYTNFMTLQQAISDLADTNMITMHTLGNRTQLILTKDGQETLHFFENRINEQIKDDVKEFLRKNELTLRNEFAIQGEYYKATSGEYEAHLTARERDIKLVDITLSVPTLENAISICDNWQKKNQEIYQFLARELF